MAKFNSVLLGRATKSVGNVTMCYSRRNNIARAKVFLRKDTQTPEILAQRARMKALSKLVKKMLPVVRKGFPGTITLWGHNEFVRENMGTILVSDDYLTTIDYEQLLCADGEVYTPKVSVSYSEAAEAFTFTQKTQLEVENGYSMPEDKVYGVLIESHLLRSRLVPLKSRSESGDTAYALPDDWDASRVKAYCFATTYNGRSASPSRYLEVTMNP